MDNIKNKTIKSSKMTSADAGASKTANWGSGHAGQQVPGQSTSMGTSSAKFAQGGKNPDWGKQSAKTQHPA